VRGRLLCRVSLVLRACLASSRCICSPLGLNRHRYPESHACEGPDPATDVSTTKNVAGQALLAKHFSTAGSTPLSTAQRTTKKVVTDPKKIAQMQKVALMQLRHRAIPADPKDKPSSVPLVDQRLHAKVVFEGSGTEKAFWFRKVCCIWCIVIFYHRPIISFSRLARGAQWTCWLLILGSRAQQLVGRLFVVSLSSAVFYSQSLCSKKNWVWRNAWLWILEIRSQTKSQMAQSLFSFGLIREKILMCIMTPSFKVRTTRGI
jgi:hypothetical protein